jgi:hypothetical protein
MAMSKNLSRFQNNPLRRAGDDHITRKKLEEERALRKRTQHPQAPARRKKGSRQKAQTVQGSKFKKSHMSVNGVPHRPGVIEDLHGGNKSHGVPDAALLNFLGKVIGPKKSKASTARSAKRFAPNAKAAMNQARTARPARRSTKA